LNKRIISTFVVALLLTSSIQIFSPATFLTFLKIFPVFGQVPAITVSPTSGYGGTTTRADTITIIGQGFTPASTVQVYFTLTGVTPDVLYATLGNQLITGESMDVGGNIRTDGAGFFKVRIRVPYKTAGTYVVKCLDGLGLSASANFILKARLRVIRGLTATGTTTTGYPTQDCLYELSGFKGGEVANLNWDGGILNPVATTGAVGATGTATEGYGTLSGTGAVVVPNVLGGSRTITAVGNLGTSVTATFTVTAVVSWAAGAPLTGAPVSIARVAGTLIPATGNFRGYGFTGTAIQFIRLFVYRADGTEWSTTTTAAGAWLPADRAIDQTGANAGTFGVTTAWTGADAVTTDNAAPEGRAMLQIITDAGTFNMTDQLGQNATSGTILRQMFLTSTVGSGATIFYSRATSLTASPGDRVTVYGTGFGGAVATILLALNRTAIAATAPQIPAHSIPYILYSNTTLINPNSIVVNGVYDLTYRLSRDGRLSPPNAKFFSGGGGFASPGGPIYLYIGSLTPFARSTRINYGVDQAGVRGASAVTVAVGAAFWTGVATGWGTNITLTGNTKWSCAVTGGGAATGAAAGANSIDLSQATATQVGAQAPGTIAGHYAYWLRWSISFTGANDPALGILPQLNYMCFASGGGADITGDAAPSAAPGAMTATDAYSATADANGAWYASFRAPVVPRLVTGTYFVGAVTGAGHATSASNSLTLTIVPSISVFEPVATLRVSASDIRTRVGDNVDIFGYGFNAETVTITMNGVGTSPQTTVAVAANTTGSQGNGYGEFGGTVTPGTRYTVPAGTPGGSPGILAQGVTPANVASNANVKVTPSLNLPAYVPGTNVFVGDSLQVEVSGLLASTSYAIRWGAADDPASSTQATQATTAAGLLQRSITIPDAVTGIHFIDIALASSPTTSVIYRSTTIAEAAGNSMYGAAAPTESQVTVGARLWPGTSQCYVGDTVTLTGRGLLASTVYYVWFDQFVLGTTVLTAASGTTSTAGTVVISFKVPPSVRGTPAGAHTPSLSRFNAFDNADAQAAVAACLTVREKLDLSPSTGAAGSPFTISATGLQAGVQYQAWWYRPADQQAPGQIPNTALPLGTISGQSDGNGTLATSVPSGQTAGLYRVDLATFANPTASVLVSPPLFNVGGAAGGIGQQIFNVYSSSGTVGFMATGNIYDDSSLGFMYARRNPPKVMFPKTDSVRINQVTKAPTWSDYTHLVMVGGRAANPTLAYYEDNGMATLKFWVEGGMYVIKKGAAVVYTINPATLSATNDYFIMEVIQDGAHTVIALWGIGAPGTYAAGVYFDGKYTDLASLTAGYYVVRWTGATTVPVYPTEFTIVAEGS